ncbi:MAG: acyl-CoA dehydrogenase family protein [Phenylobacterium sp.]|jgi:alkylation response protein AidB-like acyl-CoA dehydrogenase|uniref:acyl-CoA dehydrogenase family protein n=1 Tax=Phenylobacterium sp. TaxID=1871053 RepID=UPI002A25013D|nr:acyl-CoA dehydrogenase family protein [Phenylobacterium sp.]MDD3837281.1 acyl-CoA dehydrogenase family protein [Phenylobacterium sp.]MDX9997518.1 acyl-CoA dehydrogenase family protein [Phenylobacterium sp.]
MADFGGADLDAFRAEARGWLEENFPASLRGADDMTPGEGPAAETEDRKRWKQAMADKGWGAPTWPRQYGGAELTGPQAVVLAEEMDRIGAYNPMAGMGVSMIGPTLLEYGAEDQKQRHLPPIVRGEIRWCQGYSEPGAGSDLASLQTKCEDAGDHWLVNGQKIWTSGAQYADWCFCLVRTDTTRKHEGISFVLIDMHQPGVEVRPIKLIAGHSPFCETFFTNARVEKNDMVGPLNGGWTVGKRLLQFERSGSSRPRSEAGPAPAQLAKDYVGVDEKGRIADSDLRLRIAANDIDRHAFVLTQYRAIAEAKGNQNPSATTSIMKNANTVITHQRQELLIEIMGHQGLGWDGDEFSDLEKTTVRSWLGGKATTIFAGSYEVQNNIISKRILGLPDTTQSN